MNGQRGKSLFFFLNKKNKNITVISLNKKLLNSLDVKKKIFFRNINSKSFEIFAKKNKPNLFILAGYPQIMKENIFRIPSIGTINLHAGELPFYRGGSPLNWAIINGEKTFETSIIEIDKGIDTGKLLAKKRGKILVKDNIETVHLKANNNFKEIILEAVNNLISKNYVKKSNKTPTYWYQRKEKDNHLEFINKNSTQSYNFIRALTKPYPCAWVTCNNKRLRLVDSKIICKKTISTPGEVFYRNNKPIVYCLKGAILLKRYYFEKNKKLQLKPGDLLR
ncbi:formyltransferase family protein [Candidatus Pelagibacter sp.]|nr:formyltransferase family protein [Candidatus Pelagibacter sp.]